MTLAIVGSRDWPDPDAIAELVDGLLDGFADEDEKVVSGGARGVDTWVRETCERNGIEFGEFPADWYPNGVFDRSAGYKRNQQIVNAADRVIAVWDGVSGGTLDTIKRTLKAKKHLEVIFP